MAGLYKEVNYSTSLQQYTCSADQLIEQPHQ